MCDKCQVLIHCIRGIHRSGSTAVMVLVIILFVLRMTEDFAVAVRDCIQLFVEKRGLEHRRWEVETAFNSFSWVFSPGLARRLADEYQWPLDPWSRPLPRPLPLQHEESRATMMPIPKPRPPQSTSMPTTRLRPQIRPMPLQALQSPPPNPMAGTTTIGGSIGGARCVQ